MTVTVEYGVIVIGMCVILFLLGVIMAVMMVLSPVAVRGSAVVEAYECGFSSAIGIGVVVSSRFYMAALLFLVFDLELVLLVPALVTLWSSDLAVIIVIGCFVAVLMIGFGYEWQVGALN